MTTAALYIHIPFCRSKCPYCDFVSYTTCSRHLPSYLDAVERELCSRSEGRNTRLSSIYIGGGTPSLLSPAQLRSLLLAVRSCFRVQPGAEITVEANPGDITGSRGSRWLEEIQKAGVNRVSLGVQSFNDTYLNVLGRHHDGRTALEAVSQLRRYGPRNLNLDLIFGIPGEDPVGWADDLRRAIEIHPAHISTYQLSLKPELPIMRALRHHNHPRDALAAEMYETAVRMLTEAGYEHYELSNYALPDHQSKHNLTYWRNEEYIGVGAAAFSYLHMRRTQNTESLSGYINRVRRGEPPTVATERLSPTQEKAETLIQHMRLSQGLATSYYRARFGSEVTADYGRRLNELACEGLLVIEKGRVRPTLRGLMLWNELAMRLL